MPNKALKDKLTALINGLDDSKLLQEVYHALSTNNARHLLDANSDAHHAKKRHEVRTTHSGNPNSTENQSPERFVLY